MADDEHAALLVNEHAALLVNESHPSQGNPEAESLDEPRSDAPSQPVVVVAKATLATRMTLFACVLFIAIDYAVVMPSIWLYLQSFDAEVPEYVLGLAIGAFALSSFLLQFPLGLWLDRRSMREVLVVILWVSLVSNLFYFVAWSPWAVVVARFFCGNLGSRYC